MLNEPIAVTMVVIDALNALEIPYFIGGSLASSVHGVVRTTMDVDLVADLDPEHVERTIGTDAGTSLLYRCRDDPGGYRVPSQF